MVQWAKKVFKVLFSQYPFIYDNITLLKQSLSISLLAHKQVPKVHPLRTQYSSPISLRGKHSIAAICWSGAALVYSIIGWRNASEAGVDRSVLTGLTDAFGTAGEEIRKVVCERFVCVVRGGGGAPTAVTTGAAGSSLYVVIWSQRGISAPAGDSGYVNGLSQTNDVYERLSSKILTTFFHGGFSMWRMFLFGWKTLFMIKLKKK